MPSSSRAAWRSLAGLILAIDGLGAWLLALVLFFMSLSVAAIEGRTGDPNGHLVWWALAFFALGVIAFVTAWRTVRGVRRGRLLALPVAGAAAVISTSLIWSGATAVPPNLTGVGVGVGILLAQLPVVRVLLSWEPSPPVTPDSHPRGIGVR